MKTTAIIIPDIHGRKFWHEAEKLVDSAERVIFLGDYLDPYSDEGITEKEAFVGFLRILDFKKGHSQTMVNWAKTS